MKSFVQKMKLIELLLLNLSVVQSPPEKKPTCIRTVTLCICNNYIQLINFHVVFAVLVKFAI